MSKNSFDAEALVELADEDSCRIRLQKLHQREKQQTAAWAAKEAELQGLRAKIKSLEGGRKSSDSCNNNNEEEQGSTSRAKEKEKVPVEEQNGQETKKRSRGGKFQSERDVKFWKSECKKLKRLQQQGGRNHRGGRRQGTWRNNSWKGYGRGGQRGGRGKHTTVNNYNYY